MNEYMSLKNYVYSYIVKKINTGVLSGDDKLNELKISEELNISRTPIREALFQLASDGYLENMPRRGFKVKKIDNKTASELYEVIGILDGKVAFLALDNLNDEDIKFMDYLCLEMDKLIDNHQHEDYYDMQVKFHEIYINKCPNVELINLLKKLKMTFMRKHYFVNDDEDIQSILLQTNSEHKEIVKLIKTKNKCNVQKYLETVHWSSEKSKFDSWQ